jgi:hypothetical protein
MARKPKPTPPIEAFPELLALDETPAPVRRGRPPKSIKTPSPSSAAENDSVAAANADDAGAGAPDTLSKRLQGRKPKPSADATAAPLSREGPRRAKGQQGRKPDDAEPAAELEDAAPSAGAVDEDGLATGGDTSDRNAAEGKPVDEATIPPAVSKPLSSSKPAARWDRATDTVRFNWPEIEQTASQDGPNQIMAKLLVAARAEGAHSRWPF